MFGLKVSKNRRTTDDATSIWHKLIPGAAITLQVLLESLLSATFDSAQCNGMIEAVFRTIAFALSWIVGLTSMRWKFTSDHTTALRVKHGFVNIGVVTAWLFAVSDFPLKCWISDHTDHADTIISTTQGMLIILIQVMVSLEVFDFQLGASTTDGTSNTGGGKEEGVVNESTGMMT